MPWTKNNFPVSMKNLEVPVRDKAIEMANKLVEEGYEDARAIPIAISKAKEWFELRGETISSDITHHLLPKGDRWIIKKVDGDDYFIFDTKDEAKDKVKEMLKNKAIKVMIHDSEGKFQDVY